jgi:hypothetical protein
MKSEMRNVFLKMFDEKIPQLTFLDREKIIDLMFLCYNLGNENSKEKYNQLKETFEELLIMWGDFGKYNSCRNQMEDSWKEKAGLNVNQNIMK